MNKTINALLGELKLRLQESSVPAQDRELALRSASAKVAHTEHFLKDLRPPSHWNNPFEAEIHRYRRGESSVESLIFAAKLSFSFFHDGEESPFSYYLRRVGSEFWDELNEIFGKNADARDVFYAPLYAPVFSQTSSLHGVAVENANHTAKEVLANTGINLQKAHSLGVTPEQEKKATQVVLKYAKRLKDFTDFTLEQFAAASTKAVSLVKDAFPDVVAKPKPAPPVAKSPASGKALSAGLVAELTALASASSTAAALLKGSAVNTFQLKNFVAKHPSLAPFKAELLK